MAKKPFGCSRCDRKFSMAMHLARHMSAAHGKKKTKVRRAKRRKKKVARGGAARRVGRPPSTGSSADAIRALRAYHNMLSSQRDALDAEMTALARAIKVVEAASPKGRGRGRRRRW